MKKIRLFIYASVCLLCASSIGDRVTASNCPTAWNGLPGPQQPSKFYYLGNLNSLLKDSVGLAFGRWNNALFNTNCANLTFFESTSSTIDDPIHVENHNPLPTNPPSNVAGNTLISDYTPYPTGILIFDFIQIPIGFNQLRPS